jgi:hypothetical protein
MFPVHEFCITCTDGQTQIRFHLRLAREEGKGTFAGVDIQSNESQAYSSNSSLLCSRYIHQCDVLQLTLR